MMRTPSKAKLAAASAALVTMAAGCAIGAVHAGLASASVTASMTAATSAAAMSAAAMSAAAMSTAAPATSLRKGVSAWSFSGDAKALKESGASWYYDWAATPDGIAGPAGVSFVPMMWGAGSVTTAALNQARHEGKIMLGFNEPDQAGQSNMTVSQALALWPKLMATGLDLGSPAVSYDAATPGGWLDRFMAGSKARHYRVNFITVHWYGGDFVTAQAVSQLKSYLKAIYARYHMNIWLTEFALTNYGSGAEFPTEAGQAAFLTAATTMIDSLSYVRRYAWFSLPTSAGSGTTGLFNPGPSATGVGQAFERAR